MADTDNEAFRVGFLTRCAEEGLRGAALAQRIKQAGDFTQGLGLLLGLPVAAGLAGGGAIGYGLAKMHEPALDEDEIKAKEIADTYRVFAQRAKARRRLRQYRPAQAGGHSNY